MAGEIPEQQLMDKLTRSDELQEISIALLKEIKDKDTSVEVTVPPDPNLEKLVELLEEQNKIDYSPFTLTYPRDGTRLTIAAGTTTFDFLAGSVSSPGEDVKDMGNSLNLQRKEFMRALSINADKDTVVRIGTSDKIPIRAGSFPIFPYKQFTTVEVTVTETTEILISASTSSAAIVQMGGETSPSTHAFTGDVYENEHTIETADGWDISDAVYAQNFSVAGEETGPTGVFFRSDGLKMYVIGYVGVEVNEYDLGVAWDVSSAVYLQNFSVAGEETEPTGVFFSPDGLKMYVIGTVGDDVNEYDLSAAWDVSSAVYLQNFSVAGEETKNNGVFFSPDGLKMYVVGEDGDAVYQYSIAYRFETSRLLIRDLVIRVSTNDAVIGDSAQQRYPKATGSTVGFTKVDLSKLYFANADPANNTKINILGVRL